MSDISPELQAFLKQEYDRCRDDTLEDERETAIKRYNGEPYGDEEDGRSQVVARDTAETIDYMVISILRTIVSGEKVVELASKNVEMAKQATATIHHLMMDEQDGYQILHDWLKAGLLEKSAVAMTYAEPRPAKRVEQIVPEPLLAELDAKEAEETGQADEMGNALWRVVTTEDQPPKFCDAAIPNEEFYCSPDARTITEAPLKGKRSLKTLSDLIEMGFDKDEVETIAGSDTDDNTLSQARDQNRNADLGSRGGMARQVWWHEEWVTFDEDGDGIAETIYITRSGDFKVFSAEPMEDKEDHPFEDWCPFPMQHRRVGQSLADKVMDIERIRTVLLRQSLDGIYLANNPSTYLHEESIGDNTIEDLLTVRPGRIIRYKGPAEPKERRGNFDPSAGFAMLEFMNKERETRTGITRLNMGLDEETLNQTAKGQAQLIARGEQVEEYVARNFANGLAKLITKKARLLKRHGKPITVPIDGEYVEVDPSQWPDDMIARTRVGLGASRKDQRLMFRRELAQMQAEALAGGMSIVDEKKLFNSAKGFVADAGLGDVAEYFNDPDKPPIDPATGQPVQKPEKPDPAMVEAQAKIAADQAKLQHDQQMGEVKLQMEQQNNEAKLQAQAAKAELEHAKAANHAMLEQQKARDAAMLAQQKADFEAQLALRDQRFEMLLAAERLKMERENNAERASMEQQRMSRERPGGRLDQ